MGLINRTLTTREKAAIALHVFTGLDDWRLLYIIAQDESTQAEKPKFLDAYASRWKNTDKIKQYIKTLQDEQATRDAIQREKGREEERKRREEGERTNGESQTRKIKEIDYGDPKNRRQLYNEVIANSGDDYKTKLDAAKVFEQIQKDDREAAKAQKQSRVYLPVVCNECPLYLKARRKTTK